MTQWDEVNMVACQMIKHINKKTKTMARIRATQYLAGKGREIFEAGEYSIDVIISPENLITNYIKNDLNFLSLHCKKVNRNCFNQYLPYSKCVITSNCLFLMEDLLIPFIN